MPYALQDLTQLRTVAVPPQPSPSPAILAAGAGENYVRVLVRNVGGTTIKLAVDPVAVQSVTDSTDVFELPAGQETVIPLAPTQKLYSVSVGAGGRVSTAQSVAIPMRFMES